MKKKKKHNHTNITLDTIWHKNILLAQKSIIISKQRYKIKKIKEEFEEFKEEYNKQMQTILHTLDKCIKENEDVSLVETIEPGGTKRLTFQKVDSNFPRFIDRGW